jgi:hypothetical protein
LDSSALIAAKCGFDSVDVNVRHGDPRVGLLLSEYPADIWRFG